MTLLDTAEACVLQADCAGSSGGWSSLGSDNIVASFSARSHKRLDVRFNTTHLPSVSGGVNPRLNGAS